MKSFEEELKELINKYSCENASDTPDFILAEYLESCLRIFDETVQRREEWYGRGMKHSQHVYHHSPGMISIDVSDIPLDEDTERALKNSELYKTLIAVKNRND